MFQIKIFDFNSRPREGANSVSVLCISEYGYFNSRPREGANIEFAVFQIKIFDFNSRPREGANASSSVSPRTS